MANLWLIVILITGAALRFYHNLGLALWHDEAFSALYLRYPWTEMMQRIGLDVHPPLYYLILRVWSYVAGDGLGPLRLLSIIFGVLTIWAGYLFVKTAFRNNKLALLAALLLAVNPFQVQYALEARMYTLGTFLALLSSYFLLRALENKKFWVWYGVSAALAFYTHYFLVFTIAGQGLFLLLYAFRSKKIRILFWAALSYFIAAILYAPWLPTLLTQVKRVEQNYWIPPMSRWSVPGTVWKMMFGGTGIRNQILLLSAVIAAVLIVVFLKRVQTFQKWHVFFGFAVPLAGAVLISTRTDLYLDRYFVFASAYFAILALLAFNSFRWKTAGNALIILLIAGSLFAFFKNWRELDIKNKPGMASAAEFVNVSASRQDKIIVGSSFIFFTFKYYNETKVAPQLISDRPLKDIPHFSGTAILTGDDLILDLNSTPKSSTVWLLWTTGFGGSKPSIPKNWRQIQEQKFPDAPGFKGDIFVTKYLLN